MRKNNSFPLRSALESFNGIRQHLKETTKIFDTLEKKVSEINKETKKRLKKPTQKPSRTSPQRLDKLAYSSSQSKFETTSAYRSHQKSPNPRFFASTVTSPEYRQARTFVRDDISDYNQRTLSQKNSPNSISRFYHSEIKNLLDEKYRKHDSIQNREIDLRIQAIREERLRTNRNQIKELEEEIKSREESRRTIIPDEAPRSENSYQPKLDDIQMKIAANDAQISSLANTNESLKAELANIKNMIQQSQKESNKRSSHHSINDPKEFEEEYQEEEGEDLDIKRRIKLEKFSQRQSSVEDAADVSQDDSHPQESENLDEAKSQEAAQMNLLFELVNQYKINIEQIQIENQQVQERLLQEIHYLKDQLDAKQTVLQEERPSNQRNSADYFEVMEKEDLAKYAKGLQDTYADLEQQHLHALEENKRLQEQLNEANSSSRHTENYHRTGELSNPYNQLANQQESEQSFSRKSLQKWEEYQYKLRNTPLNHHESPHKHLSPIKDSSEKDFSKFLIPTPNRKELAMHDLHNPALVNDLKQTPKSPQKLNKKKSNKQAFASSFEGADGFVYQINKVKELVQSKIAENDAEISDDDSATYLPKRMCQTTDNFAQKSKKKTAQKER